MKNTVKGFMFLLLLLFGSIYANASNTILNNNNVKILAAEYNRLLKIGFSKNEILNMTKTEFDNNKNLTGKIIYSKSSNVSSKSNIDSDIGYIETEDKKLTTSIVELNDKYRYKVTLEWKKMPTNRGYDIIGIGIDPTVKIISGLYFKSNYCYSKNNCDSNSVNTQKITSTGATSIYKLPSAKVISMDSYLYFDVEKKDHSIKELKAYGDSAHAISRTSIEKSSNHSIDFDGIKLDDSISNSYDNIATAIATFKQE